MRLNKLCDYDIVCGKSYNWIETLEQNENNRTYKDICYSLKYIYDSLKENYNRKKFKNNTKLVYMDSFENYIKNGKKCRKNIQFDFVCESMKLIIEYDEWQHFSEARKISLLKYPKNIELYFDKDLWIKACDDNQAKDSEANRDERRAFYDSIRDIVFCRGGYKLIRIIHGQIDFKLDRDKDDKIIFKKDEADKKLKEIFKKYKIKI